MSQFTVNSVPRRVKFAEGSLHSLVEKWLSPTQAAPARVTVFSRTSDGRARFVRVELSRLGRPVAFLFFRHMDGSWHVFPPAIARPMMHI